MTEHMEKLREKTLYSIVFLMASHRTFVIHNFFKSTVSVGSVLKFSIVINNVI